MRRILGIMLVFALAAALVSGCSVPEPDASPADSTPSASASESSSTIMPVSQNAEDQLARIMRPLAVHLSSAGPTTAVLADLPNAEVTNYLFDGILDWQEIYDPKNVNAWTGEPLLNVRIEALDFSFSPLTDASEIPEVWGNKFNINPSAPAYALSADAVAQVMSSVLGRPVTVDEIMAGLAEYTAWNPGPPTLADNTILAPYLADDGCWNLNFAFEKRDGDDVDVSYDYDFGTPETRGSMTMRLVPDDTSIFGARVESITVPAAESAG